MQTPDWSLHDFKMELAALWPHNYAPDAFIDFEIATHFLDTL